MVEMKLLFNLLAVISFLLDNGKTFICYVFFPRCHADFYEIFEALARL